MEKWKVPLNYERGRYLNGYTMYLMGMIKLTKVWEFDVMKNPTLSYQRCPWRITSCLVQSFPKSHALPNF